VVPVAAEVSGTVVEVAVATNQRLRAGELLFRIDPAQYELAVAGAEASLEAAREATGVSEAAIPAAAANVRAAEASLDKARQDAVRLRRIKQQDPGALSDRRVEAAEATLKVAVEQLAAAEANLEQARQSFGRAGEENSRILQANAALEQAQVNLARTTIKAPTDGVVTDVRVDIGNFAGAGAPQMTFVSTEDVWIQADLTENNLGNVDAGDQVGVVFDVYPGRVFEGTVRDLSFGVAVDTAPLGSLPTIDNNRQWLRDAQRFPVVIDFEMPRQDMQRLRVGAQASVIVYTNDSLILRFLGGLYLRLVSVLSFAY
jgi:multidrug resistance efflux pump